jgi:hypothetical protein
VISIIKRGSVIDSKVFTNGLELNNCIHVHSDRKFPEIFTFENFPETFPTMFAHRFILAYFLP